MAARPDTDVHWPWQPPPPFTGLFVSPERRDTFYEWEQQLSEASGRNAPEWLHAWRYGRAAFDATGIDRATFFQVGSGLYDETMAHNDEQIGKLVERLKAAGEWDHTLFIVASDHGNAHGYGLLDSVPPRGEVPLFSSYRTRVPLIVSWPERIPAGQRFSDPVSMIDLLPTILDLVNLPAPEIMQGHSLAPLLLGEREWQPRPVIIDESYYDSGSDELGGWIEVIDGRWGASLLIDREIETGLPLSRKRPAPLLLFDLETDPQGLQSLHEQRPDLVEKYTGMLQDLWQEHNALRARFTRPESVEMTPASS